MYVRGLYFCVLERRKLQKKLFPLPVAPRIQGVRDFAIVQVEVIGSIVHRFEHRQILSAKMRVGFLAGKNRKEKRQVGVVRVQQI